MDCNLLGFDSKRSHLQIIKECGITTATGGSEDHLLFCFNSGQPFPNGLNKSRHARVMNRSVKMSNPPYPEAKPSAPIEHTQSSVTKPSKARAAPYPESTSSAPRPPPLPHANPTTPIEHAPPPAYPYPLSPAPQSPVPPANLQPAVVTYTPVVNVQPAYVASPAYVAPMAMPMMSPYPMTVTCPKCKSTGQTLVIFEMGSCAWIAVVLFFLFFLPLVCLPCCMPETFQCEKLEKFAQKIYSEENEEHLRIFYDPDRGRGIRTKRCFCRGEFVIEYKGELLDYKTAKLREEEYSKDDSIGSFMYFFKRLDGTNFCIDATKETKYKGRLINHSYRQPNLQSKIIELPNSLHLVLVAKRDIGAGEELLFDYGDRSYESVSENPWLLNT